MWRISQRSFSNFASRHLGHLKNDKLSRQIGFESTSDLIDHSMPENIKSTKPLDLDLPLTEEEALDNLKLCVQQNDTDITNMIGQGYYNTITPAVILRNFLENPGWYTPYTPYQAEISQGRLESLYYFQEMIKDLTGMDHSNSSLLDESSAAAEAMMLSYTVNQSRKIKTKSPIYLIDRYLHPQTRSVIMGRARSHGINVMEVDLDQLEEYVDQDVFGIMLQYPNTLGYIHHPEIIQTQVELLQTQNPKFDIIFSVATDPLALTLLTPPGEFGADVVVGSSQRFGVPLGAGGPHAAFMAIKSKYIRRLPGRIIGKTRDSLGNTEVFRMALQTREQHIKRDKATSNICTAQALLANMAVFYGMYHGPGGLKKISDEINGKTRLFVELLNNYDNVFILNQYSFYDTVSMFTVEHLADYYVDEIKERLGINIRKIADRVISISFDQTTKQEDIISLVKIIAGLESHQNLEEKSNYLGKSTFPDPRETSFMTHSVFNSHHTETEMMRYLHRLQSKDLGLNNSMIPLGSCTMKLNAVSEMIPLSWPEINSIHPYAPKDQQKGYIEMINTLRRDISEITGMSDVSFQPNSGATGEYTGLKVIIKYLRSRGELDRNICLIPDSAHGTNPASAAMIGMKIQTIKTDSLGNIDFDHLKELVEKHSSELAALMVTYPSTFGVFEERIVEICELIHQHGGQVYMDGANMNAQVGLTSPGLIGADVCHLNLHKTFCIPHGGGGPGMGPIAVKGHLVPFLPRDPIGENTGTGVDPIAGANYSSASILSITYQYIKMMGGYGLTQASITSIVNANYMMFRLKDHFKILYTNSHNCCAHEFIIDLREFFEGPAKITAIDIGKRLQDYGFHAPTISWPITNTMMIEPTESESIEEMDRYCDALISIRREIRHILEKEEYHNNIIKNAPHPIESLTREWNRSYSREEAVFPMDHLKYHKHWPAIGRVDEVYGDRKIR